jgi:hypothetical protein
MEERWTERLVAVNHRAYALGYEVVSASLGETT